MITSQRARSTHEKMLRLTKKESENHICKNKTKQKKIRRAIACKVEMKLGIPTQTASPGKFNFARNTYSVQSGNDRTKTRV